MRMVTSVMLMDPLGYDLAVLSWPICGFHYKWGRIGSYPNRMNVVS